MSNSTSIYSKDKARDTWFKAILACQSENRPFDMEQIRAEHGKELSKQSYADFIRDFRIFNHGKLTLYGIYKFEPQNEFVIWNEKIFAFLKSDLDSHKDTKKIYSLKRVRAKFKIPPVKLQVCCQLIEGIPSANFLRFSLRYSEGKSEYTEFTFNNADILDFNSFKEHFAECYRFKKKPIKNSGDVTPPLRKVDFCDRLHISRSTISKENSPWKELFEIHKVDNCRSQIPLSDLFLLVKDYCRSGGTLKCPKTEKDLLKLLTE
jgi:hypothetical protein